MKKIIIGFMLLIVIISLCACGNNAEPNEENKRTYLIINGAESEIPDYHELENAFISDLVKDGYENVIVYDTDDLTVEILENRINQEKLIVERVIGMVTNKDRDGDGIILNTSYDEYDYISYRNVDFEIREGTIILTYFIYNPETEYPDDVTERYDFILDRTYED